MNSKRYLVDNFLLQTPIEVHGVKYGNDPLVLITQRAGSSSFQHDMKPEQARRMAGFLLKAADDAEKIIV